jgi:DNA replication protein DnaC
MSEQARIPRPGDGRDIILPRVPVRPAGPTPLDLATATSAAGRLIADAVDARAKARNTRIPDCPDCEGKYIPHPTRAGELVQVLCEHEVKRDEDRVDVNKRKQRHHQRASRYGKTFPDRVHRLARLANIDNKPAKAQGKAAAFLYVDGWEQRQAEGEGLMFIGDKGTGKSYVADAIANELEARHYFTTTVNATDLPRIFRDKTRKDVFPAMVADSDLVIIHDLGVDEPTPWDAANLWDLIDLCLRARKPIIVTANVGAEDLKTHYVRCLTGWGVPADEATITVGRILDRLKDLCGAVAFIGESQRGEGRHAWLKAIQ